MELKISITTLVHTALLPWLSSPILVTLPFILLPYWLPFSSLNMISSSCQRAFELGIFLLQLFSSSCLNLNVRPSEKPSLSTQLKQMLLYTLFIVLSQHFPCVFHTIHRNLKLILLVCSLVLCLSPALGRKLKRVRPHLSCSWFSPQN